MSDPHVLRGLGAIINPANIKPGIDLRALERSMIDGGLIKPNEIDIREKYNQEMNATAKQLGISLNLDSDNESDDESDSNGEDDEPSDQESSSSYGGSSSSYGESSYGGSSSEQSSDDRDDESDDEPSFAREPPRDSTLGQYTSRPSRFAGQPSTLETKTAEQVRRHHIDSVLGPADGFSFEQERIADAKYRALEEIDTLLTMFEEDDVNISRIPRVDINSSYEEIQNVLKVLRYKSNRVRCSQFAEEAVIFGASILEDIFDGKKTYFKRYRPDLTGWRNVVRVKMSRRSHDAGEVVSNLLDSYNIGPLARLGMELIPSMVIHSKMRQEQKSQSGLFSQAELAAMSQNVR